VSAAAPASSHAFAASATVGFSALQPVRSLTVTGTFTARTIAPTSRARRRGLRIRLAPSPRRVISKIGQPQFRSTKRAPRASAVRAPSATPASERSAICTPKHGSLG
jgi:hypothetical protein